jgi:hypothetical protein
MLYFESSQGFSPRPLRRGFFYALTHNFIAKLLLSLLSKPAALVFAILPELQLYTFDKVA